MINSIINKETGAELLYDTMPNVICGSIIICAGGAYTWLSPREEWPVAAAYSSCGFQTFILKYSVGIENAPLNIRPMKQLAWAVRTVRELTREKSDFIAVCGFSAGGHLCASLGVHWNDRNVFTGVESEQSRPDAMILGYAATDTELFEGAEMGNILYGNDVKMEEYLNCVKNVTNKTVPAFIWHTVTDDMVPVQMSMEFAQQMIANHNYVELHIFPDGLHGLSVATPNVDEPAKGRLADKHIAEWLKLSVQWMEKVKRFKQ